MGSEWTEDQLRDWCGQADDGPRPLWAGFRVKFGRSDFAELRASSPDPQQTGWRRVAANYPSEREPAPGGKALTTTAEQREADNPKAVDA